MDQPLNYFILIAAIVVGIAFFFREILFFSFKVPTNSMEPTLKEKKRIVVFRIRNLDKIKRGDILVFYNDQVYEVLVDRVIGFPGDLVDITEDGAVCVNGQSLLEPYRVDQPTTGAPHQSFQVPAGKYFMLGDNRPDAIDSRHWNEPFIGKQFIIGKATHHLFPLVKIESQAVN